MKHTTLCYIEKNDSYLMLHRTKKENDENHDKWVGLGGKLEAGESPFDCVKREVYEEIGVQIYNPKYHGIVTFVSDIYGTEYMHLFSASEYSGEMRDECDEGIPCFIKKDEIKNLPIWEGDKIFLDLMSCEHRFFSLKLVYSGEKLINWVIEY